jgi:hypothetical protein
MTFRAKNSYFPDTKTAQAAKDQFFCVIKGSNNN